MALTDDRDDELRRVVAAFTDEPVLVEVRNRFDGAWSHGFEVIESLPGAPNGPKFRLRRLSDGQVLPELFAADDIIEHRP